MELEQRRWCCGGWVATPAPYIKGRLQGNSLAVRVLPAEPQKFRRGRTPDWHGHYGLPLGPLDDDPGVRPQMHIPRRQQRSVLSPRSPTRHDQHSTFRTANKPRRRKPCRSRVVTLRSAEQQQSQPVTCCRLTRPRRGDARVKTVRRECTTISVAELALLCWSFADHQGSDFAPHSLASQYDGLPRSVPCTST
jgi:hypothetical protein